MRSPGSLIGCTRCGFLRVGAVSRWGDMTDHWVCIGSVALFCWSALGANTVTDHPTGPRMTPPTLTVVSPVGVARGTTAEMTVEGLNLARASAVYFSDPGVKGTILRVKELPDLPDIRLGSNGTPSTVDVGPLPPRNQVIVQVEVSPNA